MLFSICIPVYNTSKYLDECLKSVLCQTETDYEIVLVDDGSTDESGAICDRYETEYPNIRVIHKENEGLLMTRRRGFAEAKGDFLICLDSDDALNDRDALKKIRRMIQEKNADLVIYEYIYGSDILSAQTGRRISLLSYPTGHVFEDDAKHVLYNTLLLGKGLNAIWIKAVSRKILDLDVDYSRWNETLVRSQAEDLLQTLPVLDAAQRVAYLKEPLYFYRWNPGSISKNVRPDYYYAYRTVYLRTDEYLEKWGFTQDEIHRIMQTRINMIFSVLLGASGQDREKWLQVLHDVADDPFFRKLWQKRDPAYVCKYYMLAGELILKKQFAALQVTMKTVVFLSGLKNQLLRRKA